MLTVALGALSATLILGWLLWRLILAPVRAWARRAEAIRGGGAAEPMGHYGTPEIGDLGQAVLDMADVLTARELAVRSYTDHVTHELKTPLTAIRGAAELLESDEELPAEARQLVSTIRDAEGRAEQLLAAARDIAAARSPDHHGVSTLVEVDWSEELGALDIQIEGADAVLPLTAAGLSIVVHHLAENALDAGAKAIRLEAEDMPDGARLWVSDDGPGISAGNRDRVFDPFFTTRRETGGTGMGLAIVQTLLLAHGAEIDVIDGDSGASFEIRF